MSGARVINDVDSTHKPFTLKLAFLVLSARQAENSQSLGLGLLIHLIAHGKRERMKQANK